MRYPSLTLRIFVVIADLTYSAAYGEPTRPESWENAPPAVLRHCQAIDDALIISVPIAQRSSASVMLESSAITRLTRRRLAAVLGRSSVRDLSARSIVSDTITELETKRQSVLEAHNGSWTASQGQRLGNLKKLLATPSTLALRPYLARAVAQNEATGLFHASLCIDALKITHASLGSRPSMPGRVPVVIYLRGMPKKLYTASYVVQ
jgi:hypothetical protein